MMAKRLMETAAMSIIGDSLLCVVSPRRHVGLWMRGPEWWRKSCEPFVRHPTLTRLCGAAGVGFGLWLAWRQEPPAEKVEAEAGVQPVPAVRELQEATR